MRHEACRDSLPLWMAGALRPGEAWVESEVAPAWTDRAGMREARRRQRPAPALAAAPPESRRAPRLWPVLRVALGGWDMTAVQGQTTCQMIHLASSGHRAVLTAAACRASPVDLYWQRGPAAGTFGPGPHVRSRPAGTKAFAVTVEPEGGTTKPTTPVLASASV